jgi:mannosyltransferase OCH1-like enzyme
VKVVLTTHQLWTNVSSRDLLVKEYPWFVKTWDSYRFPIQRADSIRYFILVHYGGIYIDLDNVGP